jgi:hypothetical protein
MTCFNHGIIITPPPVQECNTPQWWSNFRGGAKRKGAGRKGEGREEGAVSLGPFIFKIFLSLRLSNLTCSSFEIPGLLNPNREMY